MSLKVSRKRAVATRKRVRSTVEELRKNSLYV
jgi:hypothetical protein